MKVLLEFKNSHHYFEEYEKENNLYCPNCGKKSIWIEQGGGDYYEGANHICTSCRCQFSLPTMSTKKDSAWDQITSQLISGKILKPTTERGA